MKTTKKRGQRRRKGASEVQSPHAIFAPALRDGKHGLYRNLSKVDGRTRIALIKKSLRAALLERFKTPPPAIAQIIAERCAMKLIRAASFESYILSGKVPSSCADRDYLALTASIRADIFTLFQMSKEGTPAEVPVPSLSEYLNAIKSGKLHLVEPQTEPAPGKKS